MLTLVTLSTFAKSAGCLKEVTEFKTEVTSLEILGLENQF